MNNYRSVRIPAVGWSLFFSENIRGHFAGELKMKKNSKSLDLKCLRRKRVFYFDNCFTMKSFGAPFVGKEDIVLIKLSLMM